ncbi:MAG TPA: LLM class flavin-dependent oxidoreductase [Candidatus Limnocylindria bacterium]|nr:LLM class flavin-dependent oxidoreductase [Candidatus Limnocylindria bacterium]
MAMTFGIHIGHMGGPLSEMRRLWKFADDMGFDWFSVSDHFQESPPQGGDLDCFEAVTTMTAAALETKRVRIGSLVYCINYRNPGVLAAALTTVDHLSNGRLECGIGAGWHAHEYEAFGIPFDRIGVREDMLEEYAQCLNKLFDPADKVSSFEGTHYRLVNARNNPKPVQRKVRLWIGGGGEKRTLRAVARYADGWNIPYQSPAAFKTKSAILDEWCAKERRDPATIARTVNTGFYIGADERGAAKGEALYQSHFGKDPRGGFLRGTARQALELVGAYREAGVERLNIGLRQGPYDWEALHAYAEVVLPAFGIKRPA